MQLLNLPNWTTIHATEAEHDYALSVEHTIDPTACSHCGTVLIYDGGDEQPNVQRFGRLRDQVYMDLPAHGKRVGLHLQRRRYRCLSCRRTFMQPIPDLDEKRLLTKRLVSYIEQEGLKRTFVSIAEDVGVDEKTVRNISRDYIARLSAAHTFVTPEWLGIDELMLMKKHRCILTNIRERTAIDLLETRTKAVVQARLMRLNDRHKIELITMDMWTPYREAAAAVLPKAQVVIDKFHIQRMANICLDGVRKQIREGLSAAARRTLMHDRYVLLRRKRDLDEKDQLVLDAWTQNFPQLGQAYDLKELFFDIWQADSEVEARRLYREWLGQFPADLMWAFQPLLTAMENWGHEIFAYFSHHRATNAYTESLNSVVKLAARIGRGYSFEAIRARLIYGDGLHRKRRPTYQGRPKDQEPSLGQLRLREAPFIDFGEEINYGVDLSTLAQQLSTGFFD